MNLLADREKARQRSDETAKAALRMGLRAALEELVPGHRVWVFGSLAGSGRFDSGSSDADLAFETEPAGRSLHGLAAELEERFARPFDIVLLGECRFREKIIREGELWTLSA